MKYEDPSTYLIEAAVSNKTYRPCSIIILLGQFYCFHTHTELKCKECLYNTFGSLILKEWMRTKDYEA